jgi:hypothetical protein
LTVWRIAEELNMNREPVRLILTKDLNMKIVYAKIVSTNLSSEENLNEKKFVQTFQQDCWKNQIFCKKRKQYLGLPA